MRSCMVGDPPELSLLPRLDDFPLMDFHRADEAIREGRRLVRAYESEIRAWIGIGAPVNPEAPASPAMVAIQADPPPAK